MSYFKVSKHTSGQSQDLWDALSRLGKHAEWKRDQESMALLGDRTSRSETTIERLTQVGPSTLTRLVLERTSRSSLPVLSATLVGAPPRRASQQHYA
jgi:hypothetical protein